MSEENKAKKVNTKKADKEEVKETKKVTKKTETKKEEPKKAEVKKETAKKEESKKAEAKKETAKKEEKKETKKTKESKEEKGAIKINAKEKKSPIKEAKKQLTAEEKAKAKEVKRTNRKLWFEKNKAGIVIFTICIALIIILGTILSVYLLNDSGRTAVTYRGGKISKEVYEVYYKIMGPQYAMYYGDDENTVKQVIANKVGSDFYLKEMAEKQGIKVEKAEIDEIEKQFKDEEFVKMLKEQNIDANLLRDLYKNDVIIGKLLDNKKASITDEEVNSLVEKKYKDQDLNKYMTRHILFKTTNEKNEPLPVNEKEALKVKAQAVLNRALAGEDFAALAKEFSADGSKDNGGVIEMYNDGTIVKEYVDAVLALKDGQVYNGLVESQFGYHIIKLDKKIPNGRKESLREELVEEWYTKVMEDAQVNVKPEVIGEVK